MILCNLVCSLLSQSVILECGGVLSEIPVQQIDEICVFNVAHYFVTQNDIIMRHKMPFKKSPKFS